jgi:hypothetical protein
VTQRLPFTQATVRRAIVAARKEGLRVIGIRRDGTLLTAEASEPHPLVPLLTSEDNADAPNEDWSAEA